MASEEMAAHITEHDGAILLSRPISRLELPSKHDALGPLGILLQRVVEGLIIIGTASLIYYRKITDAGALTWASLHYRSEFPFFAGALLGVVVLALRWRKLRAAQSSTVEKIVFFSLGIYLLSCMNATVLSSVKFHLGFDNRGVANFLKTALAIALLLVTYVHLKDNRAFYQRLAQALYVFPLLPAGLGIIFLASPFVYQHVLGGPSLFSDRDPFRFQGLTSNPLQVSLASLVAISFLWPATILTAHRRAWVWTGVGLACVEGLTLVVFWSMARSVLIVLTFLLVLVALTMLRRLRTPFLHYLVTMAVITVLLVSAWRMLSSQYAAELAVRFDPAVGVDRLAIWKYYAGVALANPLGVGFNYEQKFLFLNPYQPGINAQNNLLSAWMFGGIFSVLAVLAFLWGVLRATAAGFRRGRSHEDFALYAGTVTAFVSVWTVSLFLGTVFTDYGHSILAAMALSGVPQVEKQEGRAPS